MSDTASSHHFSTFITFVPKALFFPFSLEKLNNLTETTVLYVNNDINNDSNNDTNGT